MNARAPHHGATFPVGSRPVAAIVGAVGQPFLHMLDLAQFLPISTASATDALVSETRRHLAGCLAGIEAALRDIVSATDLAPVLATVAQGFAWQGVQSNPQMIGSDLIAHIRIRAAIGLLGRQPGIAADGPAAPIGEDLGWLHDDADPDIARTASALALGEQRWAAPGGEDQAMRPDLPAEHFTDLAWTVAALAGVALGRAGLANAQAAMAIIADATIQIIARHDEGEGPVAMAAMMARRLRGRADEPRLLGQALAHRRLLLFAALAGERAAISTEAVLHALVHMPPHCVAGLCHVLGGSASDYRHLLIQLKPVRAGFDDATIVSMADAYDSLTVEEADLAIAPLRGPADLRAKLAMIDMTGQMTGRMTDRP